MTSTFASSSATRRQVLKVLGIAGAGAAGVGSLTACGGDSSGSSDSVSGALKYHTWSNAQLPVMQELIGAFSKKYPEVSVSADATPDPPYFQKLEAAGTSKTLPDVFWMHGRQFLLYASAGLLQPIDDVIESQKLDLADYPKQLLDLYTYEGKRYAIPRNNNVIGLWYNKALFDAARVPYPDETWTWAKLSSAAAELTDSRRGQFGFAATLSNQTGYWNAIYQNNGAVISDDMTSSGYDRPETIEALQWWTGFIRDESSPSYQQMVETDPFALFQSGKLAMIFDGDWQAATVLKDKAFAAHVDVSALPQGKRKASILHGSGNVVASNTKHLAAAKALVGYLSSAEAQATQSKRAASGPPAAQSATTAWVDSTPQFSLKAIAAQVTDGVLFPHSKNTEAWTQLEKKYLGDAWAGKVPVEKAAGELATAMNSALQKEH
jgi:multiple sugar transport system substrate-binding protein